MDFSKTRKSPILLQEISRKYALDPLRPIRGFVKLENNADKGLVTVIVENVKIFPAGEYCYKLLLAGIKKEQQVYHLLGSIVLSSGGRGEGTFRIRPADLNGHGSCLWEFDTMIVAAASVTNPREALHPVLQGKFRIACPADPHRLPPRRIIVRFIRILCWIAVSLSPECRSSSQISDHFIMIRLLPTGRRF